MHLRQSRWRIEEWLDAVEDGETPGGAPTTVVRVQPGVIVGVRVGESRTDVSPAIRYAGRQPECFGISSDGRTLYVRFPTSPSLAYDFRDLPEEGGRTERYVYLCATNAQIAHAQATARRVPEAVTAS